MQKNVQSYLDWDWVEWSRKEDERTSKVRQLLTTIYMCLLDVEHIEPDHSGGLAV